MPSTLLKHDMVPKWRIVVAATFSDQSSNSGEVRVLFTARTE